MKITQKIFIINVATVGFFLLGVAGVSAETSASIFPNPGSCPAGSALINNTCLACPKDTILKIGIDGKAICALDPCAGTLIPPVSPGANLTPTQNNTVGGANVLSTLWNFLTHRR